MNDVETYRAIAREHLVPLLSPTSPPTVNRALVKQIADCGLFAPFFSQEFGGTGDGTISADLLCRVREGLAQESTTASTAFATQIGGIFLAARLGSATAAREWVPRVVAGEVIAAVALTEPELGSDVASIAMPATRVPGGWRLTGDKTWIMNAPGADIYVVFARTTEGAGAKGITAFLVPRTSDGFSGEIISSSWPDGIGRLHLESVFVPDDYVVGQVDQGFVAGMSIFEAFRPSVAAFAVGLSQSALDLSVEYARKRRAFGRPISDFQAVSHSLAEMATRVEASRLLTYDAAGSYDRGDLRAVRTKAAMAKLYATESAQFVVDSAIQIHGAVAFERGHLLEHLYREVRVARVYEGTSAIQREIISRSLLTGR